MKESIYSEIHNLFNNLRGDYPISDILDIISSIMAAKIVSDNKEIKSIEEVINILDEKYPILIDYSIMYDNSNIPIDTFIKSCNSYTINNNVVEWFIDLINESYNNMFFGIENNKISTLSEIINIPKKGNIADINADMGLYLKKLIINNDYTGSIDLYATNILSLKLSFINIYLVNRNINLILSENLSDTIKSKNKKYDFILAKIPLNKSPIHRMNLTKYLIKNMDNILNSEGRLILLISSNFLFSNKYEYERSYILDNHHIDSIFSIKNAYYPYSVVSIALIIIDNKVQEDKKTFVSELNLKYDYYDALLDAYKNHIQNNVTFEKYPLVNRVSDNELKYNFLVQRFDPYFINMENMMSKKYKICKLLEICHIIKSNYRYGNNDYLDMYDKNAYRYIRIQDIKDGNIDISNTKYVIRKNIEDVLTIKGDLLISTSGTIGKVGMISSNSEDSLFSNGLHLLRVKNENIDPIYLRLALGSKYVTGQLKNMASGVTILHISTKLLSELKVPLHPVRKQEEIVSKITSLSKELEDINNKKEEIEKKLKKYLDEEVF